MSNLLPTTEAEECGPAPRLLSPIEPLPDRTVQLGALEVHRVLPVRGRRLIGPWCFFDRFGPVTFRQDKAMDVGPHPHIGLQTVTWLLDGEVVHKDSLGSECLVRAGQLSLMTAGRGIAHAEETPGDNSGKLDGAQLWVALPEHSRSVAPQYLCTPEQPARDHRGGVVTTILGEFAGAASAGVQFSPGVGADIAVRAGETMNLPLDPAFEYGALLARGDAQALRVPLQRNTLYYLGAGRSELDLSSREGARLLLIGGAPFGETVLMWWNFVARTAEEIAAARQAWERGEQFGDVPRYNGPRTPAPRFLGRPIPSPGR
ncbi:MAG: pirin family protein [Bryobacteraceae bacterium]|nr:pirin family protein [Bryobacteraceae bacterium]